MNFAYPKVIWFGAVLLPLLGIFLWAAWRKRQALIEQFVRNKALAQLTLGAPVLRQKLRPVLIFFAVALLLLAVAGPQWGFTWEEASQRGRDIIVAIDTSRSMLANDVQPNRLVRAKLAALDLLQLGQYDRFGLVAFAGTAFLQCPLTFDDEAFRQSVQIIEPGIIPQGGTAIAAAINAAREAFGEDAQDNHRILILFTDGEDHELDLMTAVDRAVTAGLKIFTVGVGTPGGELLRVRDQSGNEVFVKDSLGNVVKSRLNDQLLQQIATRANGFYVQLQGGNAMDILYERGLAPLPTTERATQLLKRLKEQYHWPLAAAILLLIIEVLVPDRRGKATAKGPASDSETKKAGPGLQGSRAPAVGAWVAFLLLAAMSIQGSPSKAQRYYKNGEYDRALAQYQELIEKNPNDERLRYNAGASAYHASRFDLAIKEFQGAVASRDLDLQQQAFYNLGNSEFRLGEASANPREKAALWEEAIRHYDAALKINPRDTDAEFNRDIVRRKLEELKEQQQQQQNDNQENQEESSEEKDDQEQQQQGQQEQDQQTKSNDSQEQGENQDQQQPENQPNDKNEREEGQQPDQQKGNEEERSDQQPSQKGGEKESQDQRQPEEGDAEQAQLGRMTPAQARQLLDAQREEEKALLFLPTERKSTSRNRDFKDW